MKINALQIILQFYVKIFVLYGMIELCLLQNYNEQQYLNIYIMKILNFLFTFFFGVGALLGFFCLVFCDLANSQFLTLLLFTIVIAYGLFLNLYTNKKIK